MSYNVTPFVKSILTFGTNGLLSGSFSSHRLTAPLLALEARV